jgi:hypothetical protein
MSDHESDSDETIEPESEPEPEQEQIEEPEPTKKPRGRPRQSDAEKAAKKVIVKEKTIYMVPDEKKEGAFKKVKNPELGVREMKKLELQAAKERKEAELGKALLSRKNGKIDKRSSTARTPAQIAATQRMLEANKMKRAAAGKLKEVEKRERVIEKKEVMKEAIREVVSEPFYEPKPPPTPYDNLKF